MKTNLDKAVLTATCILLITQVYIFPERAAVLDPGQDVHNSFYLKRGRGGVLPYSPIWGGTPNISQAGRGLSLLPGSPKYWV